MLSDSVVNRRYIIQARMRVTPGRQAEFASLMLAHVSVVAAQPGVLQYEFYQSYDDDKSFMLYEVFENVRAWETMHALPGNDQLFASIGPLIESRDRSVWAAVPLFAQALAVRDEPVLHAVTPIFRLKSGTATNMTAEIATDAAQLHAAGSIVRFDLNVDTEDPLRFMICARWPNRASWEHHQSDPHFLEMRERSKGYYDGPAERLLWKPAIGT
jgi:quinol monooxygenase YgiN